MEQTFGEITKIFPARFQEVVGNGEWIDDKHKMCLSKTERSTLAFEHAWFKFRTGNNKIEPLFLKQQIKNAKLLQVTTVEIRDGEERIEGRLNIDGMVINLPHKFIKFSTGKRKSLI
jgi:hypothetical protein